MHKGQKISQALFLRTIDAINKDTFASAKRIAEELHMPQEDARKLAMGEVRAGTLEIRYAEMKHKFVYYVLSDVRHIVEAVA